LIVTFPVTILILKIWVVHIIGQGGTGFLGHILLLFQLAGQCKSWTNGRKVWGQVRLWIAKGTWSPGSATVVLHLART